METLKIEIVIQEDFKLGENDILSVVFPSQFKASKLLPLDSVCIFFSTSDESVLRLEVRNIHTFDDLRLSWKLKIALNEQMYFIKHDDTYILQHCSNNSSKEYKCFTADFKEI